MEVTLDKFGRIVIPKPVRDALGLETGTKLHLDTQAGDEGGEISLRPKPPRPLLRKKGNVMVLTGKINDPNMDIVEFIQEQREQRIRHLAGMDRDD